jgi:bifunctional UDP-N-acetylglucosamine pyrophosphorylase / glucosamine-1-phosphate N-acetyltransferase
MNSLVTLILAAGKGTRMKSDLVKVLHTIAGVPMVAYPVRVAKALGCEKTIVVVGHQKEKVEAALAGEDVFLVHQREQLGSGHAVAMAESALRGFEGDVLILCGDVPFITVATVQQFAASHAEAGAVVSVLSVVIDNPRGYGRILRTESGYFFGIVEERDATDGQRAIQEINTGIYCCKAPFLFEALKKIGTNNNQGEYYLPDIVSIAVAEGKKVQAVATGSFQEVQGINDRIGLAEAEKLMRRRILAGHMREGVTVIDPDSTYIEAAVRIGQDTVIYPNTMLRGASTIGAGCTVEINSVISGSVIGNNVHIKPSCVIDESLIEDGATIGPFAHLRPLTVIEREARVGNFVEIKKSRIGRKSKANHLTYIGDATIGQDVNVGAGTITCNYDGANKHATIIEDGVFIGSNTALVAPVTIGKHALIGAGSTITKNVPEDTLAVARGKQIHYEHYFRPKKKT